MRYDSILDAIGNTPLVGVPRLSPNPGVRIWAKLEGQNPTGSTKDRIALAMVEAAEADGTLAPDKTILEPTSGNTGIALAMVARRKGYGLTVVIPDNASQERIGLLRLFGAEIVYSDGAKGTNGSIEVARALANDDRYFMPFQYGNPANPAAHERGTAQEIIRDLPGVTHFVAGMGTGGTLTGTGRGLHAHDPEIKVIAAEPELGDLVYGLRSLDEGFVPPIFDPAADRPEVPGELGGLPACDPAAHRAGGHLRRHIERRRHPRRTAGRVGARVGRHRLPAAPTAAGSTCPPRPGTRTSAAAEKGVEESLWW